MKAYLPFIIFALVLIAIDLYVYKSLKLLTATWSKATWKSITLAAYWVTSFAAYALIAYAVVIFQTRQQSADYFFFFMGFGVLLLLFMPKIIVVVFHLLDDVLHLFRSIAGYFIRNQGDSPGGMNGITRWQFLTRIGWVVAAIPFVGILYGMTRGRYNFRVERSKLAFKHLPQWAHGMRVVHISDIHIGSFFNNHEAVSKGIDMVNSLEPDIIFFTGDMVNNYAEELEGWTAVLSKLKARYGKYSILGNHDYGDYVRWESQAAKVQNLDRLKHYHAELGFRLLLNERINFSPVGTDPIEIIGVENWGLGGFSQYGELRKALNGSQADKFQILLSHDPSHWDAEVLRKTSIEVTLSGHTHGMQFGVEIPGLIKWSPVKYRYPRWGGLYSIGRQYLYVNRGFGYIGFPGRVGMPPEITLLELEKA